MPTLTGRTVHYPGRIAFERLADSEHPLYWFELEITSGQIIYLVSDDEARAMLPANAVLIDAVLAEDGLPTITETPGFASGKGVASGGTYTFLDDKGALTSWLAEKNANGESVTNAILRQYTFDAFDGAALQAGREAALRYTFQIKDHRSLLNGGVHEFVCKDIRRDLDVEIFPDRGWRLARSISTNVADIEVHFTTSQRPGETPAQYLDRNQWVFEHGPDYLQDPNETIGYALIEEGERREIMSYTGVVGTNVRRLQIAERGLFGTQVQEWTVPDGAEQSSKPKIRHYPYYEEDPLALASAIMLGVTPDGRDMPDGDCVRIDPRYVDEASFSTGDTARRTVRLPDKVKAQNFIESQLLTFVPGVMLPNEQGALEFVPQQTYGDIGTAASVNDTNVVADQDIEYVQDASELAMPISILWDKDPFSGKYNQQTIWDDPAAIQRNRTADPKTYKADTLSTGHTTESGLQRLAGIMFDRHHDPIPRIPNLRVLRSLWWVPVGSVVQVDLKVQDHVNGSGIPIDLSRPMRIIRRTFNQNAREMTWDLAGALERAQEIVSSEPAVTREMILANAIELKNVTGVTVSAAGVYSGQPSLVLGQKYATVDHAPVLSSNFRPVFVGNGGDFEWWTELPYTIACHINLTANGNRPGGAGGQSGSKNYFDSRPAGGVHILEYYNRYNSRGRILNSRRLSSTPPKRHARARHLAIRPQLSVRNGVVTGWPADLSGSGGDGGSETTRHQRAAFSGNDIDGNPRTVGLPRTTKVNGRAGGKGGGGCKLLGPPGSGFGAGGKITTSGGDAEQVTVALENVAWKSSGAGGRRGAVLFAVNGSGTLPQVNGDRLKAFNGRTFERGRQLPQERMRHSGDMWRSYYGTEARQNLWASSYDIQVIPPIAVTQESIFTIYSDPLTAILALQRDGIIKLIPTTSRVAPSDGNRGDFAIAQQDIDNLDDPEPPGFLLNTDGAWEPLDWPSLNNVYRLLLESNRKGGGDKIISQVTRPQNQHPNLWHNPDTGVVVRLLEFGPPDELVYAAGSPVGDNLLIDPEFTDYAVNVPTWNAFEVNSGGPFLLPVYQPFNTVGGIDSGGDDGSGGSFDLDAPPSVTATAGGSGIAVQINTPGDLSRISAFELRRSPAFASGVVTIQKGQSTYYVDTTTSAGTRYTYSARSINQSTSQRSADTSSAATLATAGSGSSGGGGGGGGGSATLTAPTNLGFVKYSGTAGAATWTRVSDANAPGTGYQYEVVFAARAPVYADGKAATNKGINGIGAGTHTVKLRLKKGSEVSAYISINVTMP